MSAVTEVGSTMAGLGGLVFGWWQARQKLTHDRDLVDLASARDVCEEGAIYLHRVAYGLDPLKLTVMDNAAGVHEAMSRLGKDYDEASERVKVRLGPEHEATRKFVGAGEAALEATRAVERVAVLHAPHIQAGGTGAKQAMRLLEDDEAKIVAARSSFDTHRSEFVEIAAREFGAKRALR